MDNGFFILYQMITIKNALLGEEN